MQVIFSSQWGQRSYAIEIWSTAFNAPGSKGTSNCNLMRGGEERVVSGEESGGWCVVKRGVMSGDERGGEWEWWVSQGESVELTYSRSLGSTAAGTLRPKPPLPEHDIWQRPRTD